MEEKGSAFKLVLSENGLKAIENHIAKDTTKAIPLEVALGNDGTLATTKDTKLYNELTRVKPESITSEAKKGIHINAYFPASGREFDIKEIGIYIAYDNENILLGRYASEQTLAKKTSQIDFFLDCIIDIGAYNPENFTIDSKDYEPKFSLPKASDKQYGNVRFAKQEDFLQKKTNLAVSIEALNYPNIIPKHSLRDNWAEVKSFTVAIEGLTFTIVGLHYLKLENHKNYSICVLLVPTQPKQKNLTYLFYDIEKVELSKPIKYTAFSFLPINTFFCKQTNKTIEFLLSASNKIYKIALPNKTAQSAINPYEVLSIKEQVGSLMYFNNQPYGIGGYDKHSNNIISINNNTFNLINPREKPLIHLIQDKLYIIGGSQSSENNYCSVEIFNPINNMCFAPFSTPMTEIDDTGNITSCVLENKIYIFFIKQFEKAYDKEKFYYCYDYLGNNWIKKIIYDNVQLENPEPNLQGKAITIGDEIYLFFTNTIQNDTQKFELSLIKLRPI